MDWEMFRDTSIRRSQTPRYVESVRVGAISVRSVVREEALHGIPVRAETRSAADDADTTLKPLFARRQRQPHAPESSWFLVKVPRGASIGRATSRRIHTSKTSTVRLCGVRQWFQRSVSGISGRRSDVMIRKKQQEPRLALSTSERLPELTRIAEPRPDPHARRGAPEPSPPGTDRNR